mgnify:CR=1 FL=1
MTKIKGSAQVLANDNGGFRLLIDLSGFETKEQALFIARDLVSKMGLNEVQNDGE